VIYCQFKPILTFSILVHLMGAGGPINALAAAPESPAMLIRPR